jgi:hypothetical protein
MAGLIGADDSRVVPDATVAETFPHLYRGVLDAVGRLNALGARGQAAEFRESAIRAYSRAWDAKGQRRLDEILARAEAAARDHARRAPLRVA